MTLAKTQHKRIRWKGPQRPDDVADLYHTKDPNLLPSPVRVKAPKPASSCQKPVCCSNSSSSALFYKEEAAEQIQSTVVFPLAYMAFLDFLDVNIFKNGKFHLNYLTF